ncbi:peptidyl-prolyl cis-trans isomerase G-like [Palaemon carinicauda]|uniref:peptidyl-prolyl cis-trans isomerase G-like n=1 Tax=Palaemon carinicauda TaxID=392227 RepID=UPI0035B5EEB2
MRIVVPWVRTLPPAPYLEKLGHISRDRCEEDQIVKDSPYISSTDQMQDLFGLSPIALAFVARHINQPVKRKCSIDESLNQPVKKKFSVNESQKVNQPVKRKSSIDESLNQPLKKNCSVNESRKVNQPVKRKSSIDESLNQPLEKKCSVNESQKVNQPVKRKSSIDQSHNQPVKKKCSVNETQNVESYEKMTPVDSLRNNSNVVCEDSIQGEIEKTLPKRKRELGLSDDYVLKELNDGIQVGIICSEKECNEKDGKPLKYARVEIQSRFEKRKNMRKEGNWETFNRFREKRIQDRPQQSRIEGESQEKEKNNRWKKSTVIGIRNNKIKSPGKPQKFIRKNRHDGQIKNPRGRPKKASLCRTEKHDGHIKNPRGRPKKASLCRTEKHDGHIKNPRGRPKKASLCRTEKHDGQIKNPRGRPKKASLCRTEKHDGQIKNPRGRPKKASLCRTEKHDGHIKNPRGRPKKASLCRTEKHDGHIKNPRGRPKKASLCRTEKHDGQIKNPRGRPKKASLCRTEKHDGHIKNPWGRPKKASLCLRPKISSRKAKETYISQEFTTKIGKQEDNTKTKKTQSSKKSNSLEISKDRIKELLDKSMDTIEKPGPSNVFDISESENIRRGRGRPRIIRLKKVGRPKRLFNKRKISFDEDTNPVLLHERELNDFPTLEANHEDCVAEETQAVQEESLHNNEGSDDDLQIKLLPVFKFPQAVGSWHPSLHIVRMWAKIRRRQLSQCNKEPEPPLLETNVNTDSIATGTSSMVIYSFIINFKVVISFNPLYSSIL